LERAVISVQLSPIGVLCTYWGRNERAACP
jgi:hypothetical protein